MTDRAKELWEDFQRYLKEAAEKWLDSLDDSPQSHAYTAIFAIIVYQAVKWWVG